MSEIVLLDGGLATELIRLGCDIESNSTTRVNRLWTGETVIDFQNELLEAHKNFIEAGAHVVETATYQINVDNIMQHKGMSETEARSVLKKAVEIAQKAREASKNEKVLIAGSIGPLGAIRCDLSEYTGAYADEFTIDQLVEWHRPRFECLVEAKCDLLAIETIPSLKEARAVVQLLAEYPSVKAWLSFSVKDGACICNGDSFSEAYNEFSTNDQLVAIGVNCTSFEFITPLLKSVKCSKPFIVYTNNQGPEKVISSQDLNAWFQLGVKYLGGCCGFDAPELKNLYDKLKK